MSARAFQKLFSWTFGLRFDQVRAHALSLTARDELKKDGIVVSVFHPKMTATDFGKNSRGVRYESASAQAMSAPEQIQQRQHRHRDGKYDNNPKMVAEKIVEQIESEEA